ncbi:FAD binding domain protein [Aspergillus sclerotioniger CBS 115572]|uniref:FAD binding domain protein n=1 Tax=Aspergillus sclerotioniger CBS 115572 TaxID=1450535 RepID=A0A317W8X6_9EURO|nr:FAD binding domain protein [Aspergillus sclerotioniger CBS 115572]PWY81692.1 FAD binding domain protein [Aspergillus sclerotioniger CBS 115572]
MALRVPFLPLIFFTVICIALVPDKLPLSAQSLSCRCYPGDQCWPTPEEWEALNATLFGNLIPIIPIGSVCHTDNPFTKYNPEACSDLIAHWPIPVTHYNTPSSPMAAWFTNFSCSPFTAPSAPCTPDPFVRYAANITSATDVQNVIYFAHTHNIRLVIRNTGHDYLGKSTGPGAIALWTHHLKSIAYEARYESSWYTGPALRLGAGVQGFEGQNAAHALGYVIVTGQCPDIGLAGGYSQGGGHGELASRFGLAADQVLEWEVVTAAGKHLTVSPEQNADLYWALSGGGGGTFAVVLGMTVRLYPEERTASGVVEFTSPTGLSDFWAVIRTFLVDTLPLLDASGTAIWLIFPDPTISGGLRFIAGPITLPGGEREDLQSYLSSTLESLQNLNMTYYYTIREFPSYHSQTASSPGVNITEYTIGGRLILRSTVESNTDALISALQSIAQHNTSISGLSLNVSRPNNKHPSNSVNPIWREAAMNIVIGIPFNYTDRQTDLNSQRLMTNVLVPQLEAPTPPGEDGGAYLNEGDFNQPDWQSVFYGVNYDRLLEIKDTYDPDQVFYGRTAVGSERWIEYEDGRLCRRFDTTSL